MRVDVYNRRSAVFGLLGVGALALVVAGAACSGQTYGTTTATATPSTGGGQAPAPAGYGAQGGQPATASPVGSKAGGLTVQVKGDPRLGKILTDGAGKTLYKFDRDTKGTSNCTGGCAQTWPPLTLSSGDPKGPSDLTGELKALKRSDGGRQVMYNDMPLHYYASDTQPGDTKGDGVGGVWHVVHPGDARHEAGAGGGY